VEHVGLFNGHLEYIRALWFILRPYGKMLVICFIVSKFGILYKKCGNPGRDQYLRPVNMYSDFRGRDRQHT
jgi:hypothetical protein